MNDSNSSFVLGSKINYKILGLIIILGVILQVYLSIYQENESSFEFTDALYATGALIAGISAIIVAQRYHGSKIFGKSYFALGLGFLMLAIGDVVWNYYEIILQIYPYPSLADVFYPLFSPFAIYHLIINIRFFKKQIDVKEKIGIITLVVLIVATYSFVIYDESEGFSFDFYFGLYYVIASAIILSLAIYGAIIFRHSILGAAWLLLTIGIVVYAISEFWYYYLETFEMYTGYHPVNTLWQISFMITVYALYKHKTTI